MNKISAFFRKIFSSTVIYLFLIIFGLNMLIPFLWMTSTSLKTQTEVNNGSVGFIPTERSLTYRENKVLYTANLVQEKGDSVVVNLFRRDGSLYKEYQTISLQALHQQKRVKLHWENYATAFKKVDFGRYFLNTVFVSVATLLGVLVTSSLAAYAFARMKFKGKDFLFYLFISMMMVPQPIYLIPSYVLLNHLGWLDSYYALIVPWLANIFTIFLLRQQFLSLPEALFDAAALDGCSRFGMLYRIALPLSRPVLVTASIFSLIGSWNSFMWPLVMTDSPGLRVLQVGLSYFSQESSSQTTLLMAASTFSIMPLVLLFLLAQKQIMASVASSGMKG